MAQQAPSKESSILIVGAGVFGLSTALHLAQDGYTNITVLDRASVPSPFSAGNDLNKIVRAEYEDPFYTELALDAIKQWQTQFWAPYYIATGYLLATSPKAPQKSRISLQKSLASIKDHPAFPSGSFSTIESAENTRKQFPMLQGKMDGWEGYLNRYAGYARAAKALEHAAKACVGLGVKLVTGESGYATELLYEVGNKKRCTGVKTADGTVYRAARTILCLGAHIGTLLPTIAPQITAKSWSVAHIQLSPTEAARMEGCPVVNCRDLGFFFEPDPDTGMIKFSANGAGYTNYVTRPGDSAPVSVPPTSNKGIPMEDEDLIKQLIDEALPQFSGRELFKKFICWCSDTADSEYIIDFVPGTEGLMVAAGDSGHAFKMLPVAGQWIKRALLEGEQKTLRWRWKEVPSDSDDISWRVGKVKDIKDVAFGDLKSRM
ncbi:FAD dependent oxidoreductase [Cadophora sp. MPI-SDFR-AT-0126]|nr:FAD dependent oxidoreductase [Leotiomycetes sp. MPI-SDFR-AT-0126]